MGKDDSVMESGERVSVGVIEKGCKVHAGVVLSFNWPDMKVYHSIRILFLSKLDYLDRQLLQLAC